MILAGSLRQLPSPEGRGLSAMAGVTVD